MIRYQLTKVSEQIGLLYLKQNGNTYIYTQGPLHWKIPVIPLLKEPEVSEKEKEAFNKH